jgi:hypothetical protein
MAKRKRLTAAEQEFKRRSDAAKRGWEARRERERKARRAPKAKKPKKPTAKKPTAKRPTAKKPTAKTLSFQAQVDAAFAKREQALNAKLAALEGKRVAAEIRFQNERALLAEQEGKRVAVEIQLQNERALFAQEKADFEVSKLQWVDAHPEYVKLNGDLAKYPSRIYLLGADEQQSVRRRLQRLDNDDSRMPFFWEAQEIADEYDCDVGEVYDYYFSGEG